MFIPPKCRLAVVAMMDLALHQGQGPVPLSAISARQQVSPSYLDLLFGRLRRSGRCVGRGLQLGDGFVGQLQPRFQRLVDLVQGGVHGANKRQPLVGGVAEGGDLALRYARDLR